MSINDADNADQQQQLLLPRMTRSGTVFGYYEAPFPDSISSSINISSTTAVNDQHRLQATASAAEAGLLSRTSSSERRQHRFQFKGLLASFGVNISGELTNLLKEALALSLPLHQIILICPVEDCHQRSGFTSKAEFYHHIRVQHRSSSQKICPFRCTAGSPECSRLYVLKEDLLKHIQLMHKQSLEGGKVAGDYVTPVQQVLDQETKELKDWLTSRRYEKLAKAEVTKWIVTEKAKRAKRRGKPAC